MGFASRTDKAHSQNGDQRKPHIDEAERAFDRRKVGYKRSSNRVTVREEVIALLPDRTVADVFPGLKRIHIAKTDALAAQREANTCECGVWRSTCVLQGWREVHLSACEYGCKVYERVHMGIRESQIQHSSVYGCRKDDEPIRRVVPQRKPVIQHHTPRRRRVTHMDGDFAGFREYSRPDNTLVNAADNPPSLMQMAKARAKALGL